MYDVYYVILNFFWFDVDLVLIIVVGFVCEMSDVFVDGCDFFDFECGDCFVFGNVGVYGYEMVSIYNFCLCFLEVVFDVDGF